MSKLNLATFSKQPTIPAPRDVPPAAWVAVHYAPYLARILAVLLAGIVAIMQACQSRAVSDAPTPPATTERAAPIPWERPAGLPVLLLPYGTHCGRFLTRTKSRSYRAITSFTPSSPPVTDAASISADCPRACWSVGYSSSIWA